MRVVLVVVEVGELIVVENGSCKMKVEEKVEAEVKTVVLIGFVGLFVEET
jgi:hypothetical protein